MNLINYIPLWENSFPADILVAKEVQTILISVSTLGSNLAEHCRYLITLLFGSQTSPCRP